MRRRASCSLLVLVACLGTAWAQSSGPHIGYIYPAGGRQGTTFRAIVGGQLLGEADNAAVSGPGVRATVVEHLRPLGQNELGDVWWYMYHLVRYRWSARVMDEARRSDDPPRLPDHPLVRDMAEMTPAQVSRLRARLFDPRAQMNTQIAEQVEVEVTIAPDAPPGDRELRLTTPTGLTNPMCFQIGALPEVREEDAAGVVGVPVLLNGQIMPGEVDRWQLRARKGQQLVLRAQARRLVPYIADAVPGWFQPTMSLRDPQGREVAYGDDYRFDPDPVISLTVPEDGVYALAVRDAIYRGRDDFVYRVAVGELPFITSVFPLGGAAGTPVTATLTGWNLPATSLPLDTSPDGDAIRWATLPQARGQCNEIPYAVGTLPECVEAEPNEAGQAVTLPTLINGRIGASGDVDVFSFAGRAGEEIVADVMARRLNSPLDSILQVLDAAGQVVATNDDHDDPAAALMTHQADSYLRVKLPQDGTYRVLLADAQQQGGEAYAYRLRLGPPQPDVVVRVTPSGVNVGGGRSGTVTVRAIRRDGFAGEVEVGLKDAPAGFAMSAARIPADKDSVQVTITAPREAPRQTVALQLEARAQIGGVAVTRPVTPAEDMMQAFAYWHLVPQQEFVVAIPGPRRVPAVWRPQVPGLEWASAAPVQVPLGGTVQVQIKAPAVLPDKRQSPLPSLSFSMAAATRGITVKRSQVGPGGVTLTVKADAIIAQVGDAGHLIVEALTEVPGEQAALTQRLSLGVLPPLPFQVVRP